MIHLEMKRVPMTMSARDRGGTWELRPGSQRARKAPARHLDFTWYISYILMTKATLGGNILFPLMAYKSITEGSRAGTQGRNLEVRSGGVPWKNAVY
jgi:hypothetical protein